ncbi:MAG: glyoxylate/hydroxypyruvate reductase A [Rhizobiaceae bacterium]|jgi:glyoxylate/hydroxypyruvate reductase A|nr:glyoxylate/hydroxypyruvate reductase A [Rhizobiaceae bacterium]
MSVLVSVKGDSRDDWMPHFERGLPGETHHWDDGAQDVLPDVDYAMVWGPQASLVARIPNVKAVFSLGAGVDHILNLGTVPLHVPVVRYVGEDLTLRMGEWVAQHCLMHLRQHALFDAQQRDGFWKQHPQPGARDVRVGIMGLGVMGTHAARVLKTIGFTVRGWSRSPKAIEGVDSFAGMGELDAFLAQTDILVAILPHTPETHHLIDRAMLERLARDGALAGPVLLNAGRGKTQLDADVLGALQDGTLKAASLDVFETEPLPAASPFWRLPNVFITPHAAAWSDRRDVVAYAVRQIAAHRQGRALENVVDRARGY